jgi:hypothetical protein
LLYGEINFKGRSKPLLAVTLYPVLKEKEKKTWGTANKDCSKILQETRLNRVANGLLPFLVGQSHESFTLLIVNGVGLFQHCHQANKVICMECRQEAL